MHKSVENKNAIIILVNNMLEISAHEKLDANTREDLTISLYYVLGKKTNKRAVSHSY